MLLLLLSKPDPVGKQYFDEVLKQDEVGFIRRGLQFELLQKLRPLGSDLLVNLHEERKHAVLVHLLVEGAVVGIALGSLPAVVFLARVDARVEWLVLSEVQRLGWMDLTPDFNAKVLVRNDSVAIRVKPFEKVFKRFV